MLYIEQGKSVSYHVTRRGERNIILNPKRQGFLVRDFSRLVINLLSSTKLLKVLLIIIFISAIYIFGVEAIRMTLEKAVLFNVVKLS